LASTFSKIHILPPPIVMVMMLPLPLPLPKG